MKLFLFILVISCILSLVSAQCNCTENPPNVPNCELLPQCGERISREPDSCSKYLETSQELIAKCNKTHFSNNLDNHLGCPNGTLAWPLLHIWFITYEYDSDLKRFVYKINGGFPGPTLQAIKGDWMLLPVINNITGHEPNLTTIHWHGVTMRGAERQTEWTPNENPGTPFMDGVPGINQCAIPNQGRFDYFFQFVDSGTFWYHSHFGAQLADGLSGAMVVKDCKDVDRVVNLNDDKLTYNEEEDWDNTIMAVTDWFSKSTAEEEFDKYKHSDYQSPIRLLHEDPKNPWVRYLIPYEPRPDTGLISGFGNGHFNISFVPKNTYRLRLINVSAMSLFTFTIQNHSFEVIEVEGMLVKRNHTLFKKKFTELPINAGQRYSILVNADQEKGIYGIRFYSDCQNRDGIVRIVNVTGFIRYDDEPYVQPEFDGPPDNYGCTDLPKDALIPYCDNTTDKTYTLFCNPPPKNDSYYEMKIIIDTKQQNVSDGQNVIGILSNGGRFYLDHDWSSAKNNTLLGVYTNTLSKYKEETSRNIFDLNDDPQPKSVIDILFNNRDPLEHPIHLHGHFFYVLGFGKLGSNVTLNEDNPIQRDTVTVPPRGWAQIRFVVNNPGVWPMHCHVDWHLGIGMLAQFVELDANKIESKPPKEWYGLCDQLPATL